MRQTYESLITALGISKVVVDCAVGRLIPPVATVNYPPLWSGYPPALIPFWNEGINYVGLWKHWFTNRPPSFVDMFVSNNRSMTEVARTAEQFCCYAAIISIVADDEVSPETEQFAREANITNLAEIDSATKTTGDDPSGFIAIPQFQTETPLTSVEDVSRYDGWFPRKDFTTTTHWWQHCCSLEVSDDIRSAWPASVSVPPWIAAPPTPQMFRDFVQAGDYRSAWLTLNSGGWQLPDAQAAIGQLAAAAGDNTFFILADAWLAASDGQTEGY